ncbi:MAG: AI-2E family transporter [Pikeienuella sp.]
MAPPRPSYALAIVGIAATLWLLIEARPVLEPIVLSLLIWFLVVAVAGVYARLFGGAGKPPGRWSLVAAATTLFLVIFGVSMMASASLAGFRENLPAYEQNLQAMLAGVGDRFGMDGPIDVSAIVQQMEVRDVLLGLAGSALGFASGMVVVLVYVVFIFSEASVAQAKLAALSGDQDQLARLTATSRKIHRDIELYLGVKCVIGLAQAVPTFAVLALVGVDGAAVWSVVIFFASFVPTIGTLIGIVFPSVVALVQFDTLGPFLLAFVPLVVIQLAGSNWLEPKLMGSSLNLSPLVILIGIFAGGAVWGITGALVAVPALNIAMIVFAQIESMRPVAILLSENGKV